MHSISASQYLQVRSWVQKDQSSASHKEEDRFSEEPAERADEPEKPGQTTHAHANKGVSIFTDYHTFVIDAGEA